MNIKLLEIFLYKTRNLIKKTFFKPDSLIDIETKFSLNYINIIENDFLLEQYFNNLSDSYDYNFKKDVLFTKTINSSNRFIEYSLKQNLSVHFIRKIIFYKVFMDFLEHHYKKFLEFGEFYDVDNIDIMFNAKFHSKEGWSGEINKLGHYKAVKEIKNIQFFKLVLIVEEKIKELEDRYNIDRWEEISIKFV
jgi:hypothetical protein